MNFEKRNTGTGTSANKVSNTVKGMGIGYITIPDTFDNESRVTYIQNCYRRERVDIVIENGGTIAVDCAITRQALKDIEFPEESKQFGSAVVFFQEKNSGKVVVTGTLSKNDETMLLGENEFLQMQTKDGKFVSVKGNANTGQLSFDIFAGGESAKMTINLTSDNSDALMNVSVKGNVNLEAVGEVKIKSDTLTTEQTEITLIPTKTLKIGTGKEPIPLGQTLQTQLNALQTKVDLIINAINSGVPAAGSADGGTAYKASMVGILAAAQAADFSKINSETSFTD